MKLLILPNCVRVTMDIQEARTVRKMLMEYADLTKAQDTQKRANKYVEELDKILG